MALVADETVNPLPFDTGGINTHRYEGKLRPWNSEHQVETLATHITESVRSCGGRNPMWQRYGLTLRAAQPTATGDPREARLELLLQRLEGYAAATEQQQRDYELEALAHGRHSPTYQWNAKDLSKLRNQPMSMTNALTEVLNLLGAHSFGEEEGTKGKVWVVHTPDAPGMGALRRARKIASTVGAEVRVEQV